MIIAILIPVHNHLTLTQQMLYSLSVALRDNKVFQIIVIDDGSIDHTYEWIKSSFPEIHVIQGDGNLWWSGAMNLGAKYAIDKLNADSLLLWNNDIVFDNSYFDKVIRVLTTINHKTIVGSTIYVAGNTEVSWSKGGYFNPVTGDHGMYGYFRRDESQSNEIVEVDWLTGMGSIIPSEAVKELNYWDNVNFPQYYGDSEFTYRAKLKGYKIIVHPELKIYNKVEVSGLQHSGSFKMLFQLMTDNRSKINFKRNLRFYQLYATSIRAYWKFFLKYFFIFGGFIKWKILGLFSIKKKPSY